MKHKLLLSLALAAFSLGANAQINEGFYRIQNLTSRRYLSLQDNKGWVQFNAGGVDHDLYAIRTLQDNEQNHLMSNPSTIIYITKASNGEYVCAAQGTDTRSITSHTFKVTPYRQGGQAVAGVYNISAEKSGGRVILSEIDFYDDLLSKNMPDSGLVTAKGQSRINWRFIPVSSSNNNAYLGLEPTVAYNGKYYMTYYAGYSFRTVSPGINIYYICNVDRGSAVYKPVTGEVIPAGTPLLIECASNDPANNKIEPLAPVTSTFSDNLLKGVYFNYYFDGFHEFQLDKSLWHDKRTAYDGNTMRLLGVGADGKLSFRKVSTTEAGYAPYIATNTAYLPVTAGTADELPLLSQSDYVAGVVNIKADKNKTDEVYTLSGVKVNDTQNLPHGIYFIGGKKVVK